MLEAGTIETLNALRHQKVAIGNHAGNDVVTADTGNDLVEVRIQQGLSPADHDNRGTQFGEMINTMEHLIFGHGFRDIVVFVAVGACKIAATHGNDLRLHWMIGGEQALHNHLEFSRPAMESLYTPSKR